MPLPIMPAQSWGQQHHDAGSDANVGDICNDIDANAGTDTVMPLMMPMPVNG